MAEIHVEEHSSPIRKNALPPKGGNLALADVDAAVDYMIR